MLKQAIKYISKRVILFWVTTGILGVLLERVVNGLLDSPLYLTIVTHNSDTNNLKGIPIIFVIISIVVVGLLFAIIDGFIKENKSRKEITEKINQETQDNSLFAAMKANKEYYENLGKIIEKSKALLSIQIYDCPDIPEPTEIANQSEFVYTASRIGGYSKHDYVTNCILHEEFRCPLEFYRQLYNIISKGKIIKTAIDNCDYDEVILANVGDLIEELDTLIEKIQNDYLKLNDVTEIEEKHFFYYRSLLELFAMLQWAEDEMKVLPSKKRKRSRTTAQFNKPVILCGNKTEAITNALLQGKRTGILTTIFIGYLHVFGNDNSRFKSDRGYFIVRSSINKNRYYLFSYKTDMLKQTPGKSLVQRCNTLYNEIKVGIDV